MIEIVNAFPHFVFTDLAYVGRDNSLLCIRTAEASDAQELYARLASTLELRGAMLETHEDALRPAARRMGSYVALICVTALAAFLATLIGIVNQAVSSVRARKGAFFAMRTAGGSRAQTRCILLFEFLLLFLLACILAVPFAQFFCRALDMTLNSFGADLFY